MRRAFNLPEEDVQYLESTGLQWETIVDSGIRWVIINDYPVPENYNVVKVNVALMIGSMYPTEQIDMAYFKPDLVRTDGKTIGALSSQMIDGSQWQRWSRHRTSINPWRPGLDNISSHMACVDFWFKLLK